MSSDVVNRRAVVSAALGAVVAVPSAQIQPSSREPATRLLDARTFGAIGDGVADDTRALQAGLDAVFAAGGGFLFIPPGTYRVSRTLRLVADKAGSGNVVRQTGILGHGAHINSIIADGGNVLEILSRANLRFFLIDGLDILGSGREGHGVYLECDRADDYLYNFCLRDIVVQDCGGDGCHLIGNVFEGQIINSYFRKNGGNGATFAHGTHGGILSAIHVFACIFGDNGDNGAALANKCYDVAFHGCYFLLNGKFGLMAENGCTLLSNCGFENNHMQAADFAQGDAGISLNSFGTLVGCTAYSVFNQKGLIRAYVTKTLTLLGCTSGGSSRASGAKLGFLGGTRMAGVTLIGCTGAVDLQPGFEAIQLAGDGGGVTFGAAWDSRNLPRLGEYYLWIDQQGRLRLKKGAPNADGDGAPVGA